MTGSYNNCFSFVAILNPFGLILSPSNPSNLSRPFQPLQTFLHKDQNQPFLIDRSPSHLVVVSISIQILNSIKSKTFENEFINIKIKSSLAYFQRLYGYIKYSLKKRNTLRNIRKNIQCHDVRYIYFFLLFHMIAISHIKML